MVRKPEGQVEEKKTIYETVENDSFQHKDIFSLFLISTCLNSIL